MKKLQTYKFEVDGYLLRCYTKDPATELYVMRNDRRIVRIVDAKELSDFLRGMKHGGRQDTEDI